ncbi:uncharacterized protein A1O9_04886 [Exophiala aquamarina CBS 119918]|uniref:Telomere length regulation protein conserved domain-containing protein n=1 Tax=Exophiala aquamarina CBS 119918 TaxID=1182545 RepID=A0A072PJH0_9EURO|nr:uncharacterized protein A1O9_04886 [Exophiala aquamarina CBS 119918]KEF60036.1 hypothetical protein A1O9_04886 [Exophiala aquamarina CBS 119918]
MEDLFKPIKTTRRVQHNIEKFETLSLRHASTPRPASTKSNISIVDLSSESSDVVSEPFSLRPSIDSAATTLSAQSTHRKHKRHDSTTFLNKSYLNQSSTRTLPDDAQAILKSQPDREDLVAVLQYLQYGVDGKHDFNIRLPGPKAAQIVHILVTITIPDQWLHLRGRDLSDPDAQLKRLMITPLVSVAGIGALLMQIRRHSSAAPTDETPVLEDAISILAAILERHSVVRRFMSDLSTFFTTDTPRRVFWQEVTSLLAGSKIFMTMAQIFATVPTLRDRIPECVWIGDGTEYSKWLSRNISATAIDLSSGVSMVNGTLSMLGQVFKRGLSLGYQDAFISQLYTTLLFGQRALWTTLHSLLKTLPEYDQKAVFDMILRDMTRKYLQTSSTILTQALSLPVDAATIGGMAAMINGLVQNNILLEAHLTHWLTSTNGDYAGLGLGARRAVIVTLAQKQDNLQKVLQKCLVSFGNKIQIQHNSILQQESATQTILLTAGYLHRSNSETLKQISGSGDFLHMVSNRLSASVPRARFLGMIVATAVSKLVDKPDKVMDFGVDEMDSEEAHAWLDLVNVVDNVGDLNDLKKAATMTLPKVEKRRSPSTITRRPSKPVQHSTKIIAIEEILDSDKENPSSEEEDHPELRPYGRPDSDPEDSDEDPTLVNRNKPSAPVYITSLIKQLNVSDDLSTTELALKTAPSLIRRKANFGNELSTNLLPLAASLLNLQEGMSSNELQRLKVEALIACLVSKPGIMGPWVASMYFEGDFSLSQRAALLAAVGLGTRELAGYDDFSAQNLSGDSTALSAFPSNRLPPKLDTLYASVASPVSAISTVLSHRTLQPMALEAADKLTGPDVLKVRTFSSRMEVQKKVAAKAEARSKRIPKDLHKVLADAIYLPLCTRLTLVLLSLSTSTYLANSTLLHPGLLKLILQTLAIIISTLGPHALQLPVVTRETLILLTQLHSIPTLAHDPIILPTILQLLLTILDLNVEAGSTAEERLVTELGSMIAELISWSSSLGERLSIPEVDAGDSGEMPWPLLVAGIQVKWQEVGRKFQGRMLGLLAGTDFDSF